MPAKRRKKAASKKTAKKSPVKKSTRVKSSVRAYTSMSGSRDSVPDERTVSRARKTAIISVTFTAGAGTLRATLFQYLTGAPVASGMLQSSGQIRFDNAGKGDAISIDGVCTGKATISINVETSPQTPVTFYEGNINFGFDII